MVPQVNVSNPFCKSTDITDIQTEPVQLYITQKICIIFAKAWSFVNFYKEKYVVEYSISEETGLPEYEKWYLDRGDSHEPILHRNAKAAVIIYDPKTGKVLREEFYSHGEKVGTYSPDPLPEASP